MPNFLPGFVSNSMLEQMPHVWSAALCARYRSSVEKTSALSPQVLTDVPHVPCTAAGSFLVPSPGEITSHNCRNNLFL